MHGLNLPDKLVFNTHCSEKQEGAAILAQHQCSQDQVLSVPMPRSVPSTHNHP